MFANQDLVDCFNAFSGTYVDAFHGTDFENVESIFNHGFQIPTKEKIAHNHIPPNVKFNGIENWAIAIFLSPSIFYSAAETYACVKGTGDQSFQSILYVKVKKDSFTCHQSTIDYTALEKEPKDLEWRVADPKSIKLIAAIFVQKGYFQKNQKY